MRIELKEKIELSEKPEIYTDLAKSQQISKEIAFLSNKVNAFDRAEKTINDAAEIIELAEEENDEIIVKRKNIEMKPMDEEEAILQMNLLGHEFFVYKDMHTNKVCVLYKRKDGNYGIIETQ